MATERNKDIHAVFIPGSKVVINESERLRFARQVLGIIGVVCVAVFAAYAVFPDNKALVAIFELIKIGVLPLMTLVVSFYFPNKDRN